MGERIDFAYAGDDPEWDSYVERSQIALAVLEGDVAEAIGMAFPSYNRGRRRYPPGFRMAPADGVVPTRELEVSFQFDTHAIELRLTNVRVYETGVAFTLVAKEKRPGAWNSMAGPLNLGPHIRPDLPHRARIVVDVGGQVLSNVFPTDAFPEDPLQPWLSGGGDFKRRRGDSVESGAHYFLTPHTGRQKVLISVAYPECGMEMASIEIGPDEFTV